MGFCVSMPYSKPSRPFVSASATRWSQKQGETNHTVQLVRHRGREEGYVFVLSPTVTRCRDKSFVSRLTPKVKIYFHAVALLTRHHGVPLVNRLFGKELVRVLGNISFVGVPLGDFSADYRVRQDFFGRHVSGMLALQLSQMRRKPQMRRRDRKKKGGGRRTYIEARHHRNPLRPAATPATCHRATAGRPADRR